MYRRIWISNLELKSKFHTVRIRLNSSFAVCFSYTFSLFLFYTFFAAVVVVAHSVLKAFFCHRED